MNEAGAKNMVETESSAVSIFSPVVAFQGAIVLRHFMCLPNRLRHWISSETITELSQARTVA